MMKLFLLGGFRGIVADLLWLRAEENKKDHDWDRLEDHRRADHQAPAPLPLDLDLSGLEPGLQRLGRVGCPRRQVHVDQAGDQVRSGGRQEEPALARPDLGHGLVLLPQARLLRRIDHPPPAVPRRRGRGLQDLLTIPSSEHPGGRATTISSWATAGSPGGQPGRYRGDPLDSGTGDEIRSSTSTRRRSARDGPTTSRSARCRRTPRSRYAAGLEKMSIDRHRGHLRRGRQGRMVQRLERVGSTSASTSSCRTTRSARRQAGARQGPARRHHAPRAATRTMPENQLLLDQSLGRPDELPLLEGAVPG